MKIERYKTIGVQMEIPSELQVLLWKLQEEIRCKQTRIDYLQVYELKIIERKDGREQVVLHRSEYPNYEKLHHFQIGEPIVGKVFIIEEEERDRIKEIMMLASEY